MPSLRKFRLAGMAILAMTGAGAAVAGSLQIGPTSTTMVGQERTATVSIRNSDSQPVTVQIRAMDWTQQNGEDMHTPSAALVVSPPFTTLQPGEAQTVRLLIDHKSKVMTEQAFRLVIDEVPNPVQRTSTGVQTALRLLSPVFLSPSTNARPKLAWTAMRTAKGVILTVRNNGDAHERFSDLQITSGGKVVGEGVRFTGYVLAKGARTWVLPPDVTGDAMISGAGNYGPVNARVAIAR